MWQLLSDQEIIFFVYLHLRFSILPAIKVSYFSNSMPVKISPSNFFLVELIHLHPMFGIYPAGSHIQQFLIEFLKQ